MAKRMAASMGFRRRLRESAAAGKGIRADFDRLRYGLRVSAPTIRSILDGLRGASACCDLAVPPSGPIFRL